MEIVETPLDPPLVGSLLLELNSPLAELEILVGHTVRP